MAVVGGQREFLAIATNTEDVRLLAIKSSKSQMESSGTSTSTDEQYFGADAGLLQGHEDIIICMDIDWSGHWLVTGAKDNTARLWRINPSQNSFTCNAVFTGHAESLGAISLPRAAPPEGSAAYSNPLEHPPSFLLTGSQDKTLKRWDISPTVSFYDTTHKAPRAVYTRKAHDKDINALDVNHNSALFASASQDRTVKIWSLEDGEAVGILRGHRRGVWSVKFAPKDTASITGEGGERWAKAFKTKVETTKRWNDAALTLNNTARAFYDQQQFEESVVWYSAAFEKFQALFGSGSEEMSELSHSLVGLFGGGPLPNGRFALSLMARNGAMKLFELVWSSRIDYDLEEPQILEIVTSAAESGQPEVFRFLNKADGVIIPISVAKKGLLVASSRGHYSFCEALLQDFSADLSDIETGEALLFAVHNGHTAVVSLLVQRGASLSQLSDEGKSAAYIAAYKGYEGILDILMSCGISSDESDGSGFSLLHAATKGGHTTTTQLLLAKMANPNIVSQAGKTPIYEAAFYGWTEILQILLRSGAIAFAYFKGQYGLADPDPSDFSLWGHFTQILWKASSRVGCATVDCSSKGGVHNGDGSPLVDVRPFITVCNYFPAGNARGMYGVNVGQPLGERPIAV